jgi:hypothetical protein
VGHRVAGVDLDGAPCVSKRRSAGDRRVRAAANGRKLTGAGQFAPGAGEPRVGSDCFLEQFDGVLVAVLSLARMLALAGKIEFIGSEILGPRTPRGCLFGLVDYSASAETAPN